MKMFAAVVTAVIAGDMVHTLVAVISTAAMNAVSFLECWLKSGDLKMSSKDKSRCFFFVLVLQCFSKGTDIKSSQVG